MTIGVVIATYGDRDEWAPMVARAAASVERQFPLCGMVKVWRHGEDLRSARNGGAAEAVDGFPPATHLVFLDGDDELGDGYLDAMDEARAAHGPGRAIFRPNTIGVYPDGTTDAEPAMIPRTDMRDRNCCVIGTMVPASLFTEVGGFGDYPHLEDWALFRAMLARGAGMVDVPAAVYRVHVRDGSRNAPSKEMNDTYRRIRKEIPL